MTMRAKFRCTEVVLTENNQRRAKMSAVSDHATEENERYHKYTPSGQLEITVDNPALTDFLVPGKSYYLDFTATEG